MARPLNYEPALPECLYLTLNLKQHTPGIRPFLDSLPKPFTWLVESDIFTNFIKEASYTGSQLQFEGYIKLAQDLKGKGNEAFGKGQRKAAVKAFKEGIVRCLEALNTKPSDEKERFAGGPSFEPRGYVPLARQGDGCEKGVGRSAGCGICVPELRISVRISQ